MYFGTSDGMISFNGCDWKILEASQNNIIRTVASDDDGKIYMGSYDEFGYWQRDTFDQLQYTSLSENLSDRKDSKEEIWNILITKKTVYFQSFSSMYKYDKHQVAEIVTPGNIMFLQAVRDQLFLQNIDGGIYELEESDKFQLLEGTDFFSNKKVVFILPFGEKGLLVGTEQHGVFIWENNEVKAWSTLLQNDFLKNQLNKGIQLSSGDFVFGTILNGVYILNAKGQLKSHLTKQTGLPDNTVLSIVEGEDGNLWLGLDRGIVLVDLKNPLLFFKDVEGDLGTVYTASTFEGHLYLGTNHGVFFRKENNGWNGNPKSDFQFLEGTQGQVWDFRKMDGQLLCGHNEGTFSISKNKVEKISTTNGGWVMTVFPEDENVLLQGTYSGLVVFKKDAAGKWIFSHRVNGFLEPIKEMVIDDSEGIWLAHPIDGLYRVFLDSSKTEIQNIYKFSKEDGLPSGKMINLLKSAGNIFVKSDKQWFRFDQKTKRFLKEGIIRNQEIQNIEGKIILNEDESWFEISPNQVHYFTNNQTISKRDKKNILPVSLVSGYENIIPLDSMKYWFCLKDGYAIFDAGKFKAGDAINFPPIKINQVEILTKDSSTLISPTEANLQLKKHQNRLRFHFYQPTFDNTPSFRYRMKGLGNNWSDWTTKSDKEYFNLPAGKYTFYVETEFSNQPASFTFQILSHWSQTPVAFCLYFLGLLGLLWVVQIYQKRKYLKAKLKLETEQKRQLQKQQMNAENEKLQLVILSKSKDLANSAVNLAKKNEILLKIKDDLQQLKKSKGVQIPVKGFQQLLRHIEMNLTSEKDWELFEKNFNQVHEQFLKKIKIAFPELTPADLQLAAYLKMNLSSKEIAPLFHISLRGVENKRYRLRKKMGLTNDANLTEFLMNY
jgi:ligand-binding sensor domain-containing protein/DNA-binding CsgD family transcriptional regulator